MTLTATDRGRAQPRLLSPTYAATTVGMFALCAFVAFEATAITTVMPTVAAQLDGVGLYALSFAAPLASGVVGMVAAGGWSDRRGPVGPAGAGPRPLRAPGSSSAASPRRMEVLVAGRVLQGLGGGALTVCLYVLVGLIFPAALQPAIFTSFAAAWVLPTLFGPALAAYVAHVARLALGVPRRRRAWSRPGGGAGRAGRCAGSTRGLPGCPRPRVATGLGGGRRGGRARPGAARVRGRGAVALLMVARRGGRRWSP